MELNLMLDLPYDHADAQASHRTTIDEKDTVMLRIEALPAFSDNYIWLLQDADQRRCAVVDPGDAAPVQRWLAEHPQWTLSDILVTHHHADHVGGVSELKGAHQARVWGPARESIPALDEALEDERWIEVLGERLQVLEVPGHTLGHIAYYLPGQPGALFCGDTLFAGGCGRLFEGTPAQMQNSLERLAQLPDATRVYCAHEYTLSNLRFAQAVEPDNPGIAARLAEVEQWRSEGRISLPSTLAQERASNPFLRCQEPAVQCAAKRQADLAEATPLDVFAALREWKNHF